MAALPTYFEEFLTEIRLTDSQKSDCAEGHRLLRERLMQDDNLKPIVVETFLQGSYRRNTATRKLGNDKSDVDIVVVTNLDKTKVTPSEALGKFKPFLEKHYSGKYERKAHAWRIILPEVDLDLVPCSAPSVIAKGLIEAASTSFIGDERWLWENQISKAQLTTQNFSKKLIEAKTWQDEILWIPNKDDKCWEETNPLAQIQATIEKNNITNGNYVNVVKCLKWWRIINPGQYSHPKGYPIEHLIWKVCPDGITFVAEGIVRSLEYILGLGNLKPNLPDHGVRNHDVLAQTTAEEWTAFQNLVKNASVQARTAFDEQDTFKSALLWRKLFGEKFPEPPKPEKFTDREVITTIRPGRVA